ncbi:DUF6454 family protein [Paenibacillus sp. GCM10023250]|uniref:DUF6454 family protein n=1 Tax=Paenibacillus sp. GCM10023250 TaxID=3252648 RepID=UPI003613BB34
MEDPQLTALFRKLTRGTRWEARAEIGLQFGNGHAQGMIRVGELYYLSSVELTEVPVREANRADGYDRSPGKGIGRLFAFDGAGRLVRETILGEGDMYHPGGLDYDGESLWLPVAEYRPNSRAIVYRVDPRTLAAEEAFRVPDHVVGVACDGRNGRLVGYSWGSRVFYEWDRTGRLLRAKANGSHFVDYQDGHYAGGGQLLLSGIAELPVPGRAEAGAARYELGGLALVDLDALAAVHEVPVALYSPGGHVLTRNPVFLERAGDRLRLYAVPDDDRGALLVYESERLGAEREGETEEPPASGGSAG